MEDPSVLRKIIHAIIHCKKHGWNTDPEDKLCRIYREHIDLGDEAEFLVRLLCALDENCVKAVIITEDNIDWDMYLLVDRESVEEIDKVLDEIERYVEFWGERASSVGDEESTKCYYEPDPE